MKYFLVVFFLIPHFIFAQSGISLMGGFDVSWNNYTYLRHKKVLRSHDKDDSYGITNVSGIIQYRINKLYSFDVGLQNTEFFNQVLDSQYLARHPENRKDLLNLPSKGLNVAASKLSIDKYFTTYYFQINRYFPLDESFDYYFYIGAGLSNNVLNKKSSSQGVNTYDDLKKNETLRVSYNVANNYTGYLLEAGWNALLFKKRATLYIGFRYCSGFKRVLSADYLDIQNNTIINHDHINSNGTYMGFVFKLGMNLHTFDNLISNIKLPQINSPQIKLPVLIKKHPHPKQENNHARKVYEKAQEEDESIKNPSPELTKVLSRDTLPFKVENRSLVVKERIKVNNRNLSISIWDFDKVDNDIISLYLNKNSILHNYHLKEEQRVVLLELKPGINYLILHAEDMGQYEPCTTAIIINDKKIELKSTLEYSEVIEIFLEE